MALTYNMLPHSPEYGVILHCPYCGHEFSAQRGDYFLRDMNTPVRCGECDEPLKLVKRVIKYVTLQPARSLR